MFHCCALSTDAFFLLNFVSVSVHRAVAPSLSFSEARRVICAFDVHAWMVLNPGPDLAGGRPAWNKPNIVCGSLGGNMQKINELLPSLRKKNKKIVRWEALYRWEAWGDGPFGATLNLTLYKSVRFRQVACESLIQ